MDLAIPSKIRPKRTKSDDFERIRRLALLSRASEAPHASHLLCRAREPSLRSRSAWKVDAALLRSPHRRQTEPGECVMASHHGTPGLCDARTRPGDRPSMCSARLAVHDVLKRATAWITAPRCSSCHHQDRGCCGTYCSRNPPAESRAAWLLRQFGATTLLWAFEHGRATVVASARHSATGSPTDRHAAAVTTESCAALLRDPARGRA